MGLFGKDDDKTILIVEDDESAALLLTKILETLGYKTKFADGGVEALKQIQKIRPDLVLLDIMMPGMDGSEVLSKIKNNPETKDIPVIIVTALTDIKMVEKHFQWGASGYITKPIDPNRLKAKIDSILSPK